jgi:hypothetical protein
MLKGKSLTELAQEVDRQAKAKIDYLADTRKLRVEPPHKASLASLDSPATLTLDGERMVALNLAPMAHEQIGEKVGIPKKYYDRMLADAPELWATNVNHWFQDQPEVRMVRSLQYPNEAPHARAFLSERFHRYDNIDLMGAVLPILANRPGGLTVQSSEITDRKLYLKVTFPDFVVEIQNKVTKVGDAVEFGLSMSNSEVGLASLNICPLVMQLSCLNGATIPSSRVRKFHIGRAGSADENFILYSNETLRLDDQAFWAKVQDVVRSLSSQIDKDEWLARVYSAMDLPPMERPPAAIKQLVKAGSLYDGEGDGILGHLIKGGDLSAWGLAQAVSRYSQDIKDYDRATDLEEFAGKVITLDASEWKVISSAN